jgi:peptidoglycan/LPS O-acetylase OafA/YrhL
LEGLVPRLRFLDGLRGWGAVFVLLYHIFCDGLPFDADLGNHLRYFLPFSGGMAIFVFFVVSGFSLSIGYLAKGDLRSWVSITAGRYVRLAIPIFAACLIVHVAMLLGLIDPAAWRLERFRLLLNFAPATGQLFQFSFFDVFFNYSYTKTYIGPLWTMAFELLGSFLVLLAILLVRPMPFRPLLLVGLAGLILSLAGDSEYAMLALFPIGAALADGFHGGWIKSIPRFAGLGLFCGGCLVPLLIPYSITAWGAIGASALVAGSIVVPRIRDFLDGPLSAHLGRISFPLYLMHGPVLFIFAEPMMRNFGINEPSKFLIDCAAIVVSYAAALLFLPINNFAIAVARIVGQFAVNVIFSRPAIVEPR